VILNKSPISIIISPIGFQKNDKENDKYNISSKNQLKNLKKTTSRRSYLDLELSILVEKFNSTCIS
jgi:hypothetical protein